LFFSGQMESVSDGWWYTHFGWCHSYHGHFIPI